MIENLKARLKDFLGPESLAYATLRALRHPHQTSTMLRRRVTRNSIFTAESELSDCSLLPEPLLRAVWAEFQPRSVLDVGCGTGRSLDFFLAQGAEASGVEGSDLAITRAQHPECIRLWNLNQALDLGRRFDLVWCFEVAEHIHPAYTDTLLQTLTRHSDQVVMSAAHPGQGGEGHFNEQPRPYWIEQFADLGYRHDEAACMRVVSNWDWYPENVYVFRRVLQAHAPR